MMKLLLIDLHPPPQTVRPVVQPVNVPCTPPAKELCEDRLSALPALGGPASSMAGRPACSLFCSVGFSFSPW